MAVRRPARVGFGRTDRLRGRRPAGYLLYAPAHLVPRSVAFPTAPVSGDAVLLMTGRVVDEFTGGGIGRMLVQGVAKDLTRGVRAIEAFGLEHGQPPEGERYAAAPGCLLPADFLRSVGFKTVRPHYRHPGCGSTCAPPCRGARTWSRRSSGCSAASGSRCSPAIVTGGPKTVAAQRFSEQVEAT